MREVIEGEGLLESIALPKTIYTVGYRFEITSTLVRRGPGVASLKDNIGTVWSLDGTLIPEGEYHLTAFDGEILKVQNAGLGEWVILADSFL
jgi:hypothetical protein